MTDTTPRVRFAPSPTGYFHVGGARTALYNWLFARHHRGTFVLRIEDTDSERNREEWVDGIVDALAWLGLDLDEGPIRQSTRRDRHLSAAAQLLAEGRAYYCDCTREAVEARRAGTGRTGYDGFCRDRGLGPGPGRALRFRTPDEGETVVDDVIRGEVRFANSTLEDFVVQKANGEPLFLLANVVDDLDMAISHVIRGEEHLPNTPKALLLFHALAPETPPPVFAHVPVLVNEKRQKLSKRRDPVALEDYRTEGYLPEAMRTYLVLLGWSPPDGRERLSLEELIECFDLDRVGHSPAFFDPVKLAHFNGELIRELPVEEFVRRCRPWMDPGPWGPGRYEEPRFASLAGLVQERVDRLADVPAMVDFLFLPEPARHEADWEKVIVGDPVARAVLEAALALLAEAPEWTADAIREAIAEAGACFDRGLAKAQAPVRVATTGRRVGPPLFESLAVLGRDETLRRIEAALDELRGQASA
jgi:glutamyl-tRNA synthetase